MKSKTKPNLVVVAHPDDETLFFAGLLLADKKHTWHVVCVTDGNADGQGKERHKQFISACKMLGVAHFYFFDLPDRYETRLDIRKLKSNLSTLPKFNEVYTHGPLGEYGHPHHQDVCLAVHEHFLKLAPVWSVAQNCSPDRVIEMTKAQFAIKARILSEIYFSETERFIGFIPNTSTETFCQFDISEVRAVYAYLTELRTNSPTNLKRYKWFAPYLKSFRERIRNRPF